MEEAGAIEQLTKAVQQHVEQSDALIRAVFKPNTPNTNATSFSKKHGSNTSITSSPCKLVDKYCDACGSYGHIWSHCDFTAKLVKGLDFIAGLDTIKKQTLLEVFHQAQTQWHDRRQVSLAGKARVLFDAGNTEGLYNLIVNGDDDEATSSSE